MNVLFHKVTPLEGSAPSAKVTRLGETNLRVRILRRRGHVAFSLDFPLPSYLIPYRAANLSSSGGFRNVKTVEAISPPVVKAMIIRPMPSYSSYNKAKFMESILVDKVSLGPQVQYPSSSFRPPKSLRFYSECCGFLNDRFISKQLIFNTDFCTHVSLSSVKKFKKAKSCKKRRSQSSLRNHSMRMDRHAMSRQIALLYNPPKCGSECSI